VSTKEDLTKTEFQGLLESGKELKSHVNSFLKRWEKKTPHHGVATRDFQEQVQALEIAIRHWFNLLDRGLLPFVLYERRELIRALDDVVNGVQFRAIDYEGNPFDISGEKARTSVNAALDEVLTVIQAAPKNSPTSLITTGPVSIVHRPNTAFILMWMDKKKPELEDVTNAFKEIFARFGIKALRADDVEHSDRITDLVLDHIRSSEFLIADLTGERPNVYYEVGFAHASSKRPILFRKKGTPLHFDLSVHNVPEYENLTQLKELLQKRLEEITSRKLKRNRK
jgi:hypothetical protein